MIYMILDNDSLRRKYKDIIDDENFEDVGISLTVGGVKEYVFRKSDYVCGTKQLSEPCLKDMVPEVNEKGEKWFILQPAIPYIVRAKERLGTFNNIIRIFTSLYDVGKMGLTVSPLIMGSEKDEPIELMVKNETPSPLFLEYGSKFCQMIEADLEIATGNVNILVTDDKSVPLSEATVTLINQETNQTYVSKLTDDDGFCLIENVVYGMYDMKVTHQDEETKEDKEYNHVIQVIQPMVFIIFNPEISMINPDIKDESVIK